MKVLIIEDNRGLATRVKLALGKHYIVDIAHTGLEGLAQAQAIEYSVIILDLGLPDMHGSDVCKSLRESGVTAPILILTATHNIASRVELLNKGADDYQCKPFSSAELLARTNALARRRERTYSDGKICYADLEIDPASRQVSRSGVVVPLRRKEFDILQYLVANNGRAVSREMIIDHAWENSNDRWNNSVDVHIKRLRDKIDRPFGTPLIKTAYGIGYMVDSTPQIMKVR